MDWSSVVASEFGEEEMSMLAVGFVARMRKRTADSEDELMPTYDGKSPRRSSSDEEAQKDWAIILVDSLDRATNDQPVSEGVPSEVSVPLEEGIPAGGPSVDEIGEGSPSGVAAAPPRPVDSVPSRRRLPDQVLLSTYVPPHERIHPPVGMVAPDLEGAREIIHRWSPFSQAERPVVHMRDLYPNYFRVPVAVHALQYSIPFPVYLSKEAFQLMAEDGMFIHNHDSHLSAELVHATLLGCYLCVVISF